MFEKCRKGGAIGETHPWVRSNSIITKGLQVSPGFVSYNSPV